MIISFSKMMIYVTLASKQLLVCRASSKRDNLNNARQLSSLSMDYDGLPVHEIYDEYPAFDFYNDKCKSSCGVTATMSNRLIMNSCPKCMQEYAHEHCNMWYVFNRDFRRIYVINCNTNVNHMIFKSHQYCQLQWCGWHMYLPRIIIFTCMNYYNVSKMLQIFVYSIHFK